MKKTILLFLCLLLALPALSQAQAIDGEALALETLADLAAGDYAAVFASCDEAMREALGGEDGVAQLWAQLEMAFGAFETVETATSSAQSGYLVVLVQCVFATSDVTLQLAYDSDGAFAGLSVAFFAAKENTQELPGETVLLREGAQDETPATLLLPQGEGPFPCVILVHGSGASDKNLSAYGAAPFLDLAQGLAERGIASIRYDKYTYAHSQLCMNADFTVQQEYINDALAAFQALEQDERISSVFVVGLSHGAMLAPRIMEQMKGEKLLGAVLLEGSPLPLWQIMLSQMEAAIAPLSGEEAAQAQAQLDAQRAQFEALAGMTDEERMQAQILPGVSGYYFYDEASFDAAKGANALGLPLLIVQGGKDFQVTPQNGIDAWKEALDPSLPVEYAYYENMTHLLFDLQGESTASIADYVNPGPVSTALLDDMAAWILRTAAGEDTAQ